jgi:DNA replication protein DnaC|nr:MAG TPA_asm: Replicative helicase [Caudoviricetes sp.]
MYKCWYGKTCDRAKENCYLSCVRYKLMHSLFNLSNLPEYLWIPKNLTCSNIDSEAFHQLKNIYNDIYNYVQKGKNLYIFSNNCGNGKTSWTIKLMFSYFDKIWHKSCFDKKALFINVPSFLYDYKRSISQKVDGLEELCNDIEKVDLVIWDDIGESNATSFEHQILLQYIDRRISAGKSNFYTSNKDKEQLENCLGPRLVSRIYNCSTVVELREEDKRGVNV